MSDAYRTPGRDIDTTAVETAKIHEAAETKRKLIEEREQTRRAWGPIPQVAAALVAALGIVVPSPGPRTTRSRGRASAGTARRTRQRMRASSSLRQREGEEKKR